MICLLIGSSLNAQTHSEISLAYQFLKSTSINQTDWKHVSTETDLLGHKHYRFQQFYEGLEVVDRIVIVSGNNGNYSVKGTLEVTFEEPSKTKKTKQQIEKQALEILKPSGYSLHPGTTEEVWYKSKPAYRVKVHSNDHLLSETLFFDVQGNLLKQQSGVCHVDTIGIAETVYYGNKSIGTSRSGLTYILKNNSLGKGIETLDLNHQLNYQQVTSFTDNDNNWQAADYSTDAHYCAEKYYDFLQQNFARNSIDGNGQKLISYLNYGTGLANAFWNGNAVVYGSGNNSSDPMTTLDIAGHEFTHGLIQKTAGLNYSNEPGTINEAIADILGTSLEFFSDPSNANWTIAEKCGPALRSMKDPALFNQPDTYSGQHWYYGTGDNGGVHINSGFINKWFYLLAEGGSGTNDQNQNYFIQGIGISQATAIVYQTLQSWLLPQSGFEDLKEGTIHSAATLYGTCTPQYIAVVDAWHAVGLGNKFNSPLSVTASQLKFCEGDSILLIADGIAGSLYTWYLDGVSVYAGSSNKFYAHQGGIWMVSENRCGTVLSSSSILLELKSRPDITLNGQFYCPGESVTLSALPQGGSFSIPNPYSGTPLNFSYTVTNASGCSATETARLEYFEIPVLKIYNTDSSLPIDFTPVNLEANLPGNFSGNGVIDNIFYPAVAGEGGPYTIRFRHSTINGCEIEDSIFISVTGPCEVLQEDTRIECKESNYRQGDIIHLEIKNAGSMIVQWTIPSGYKLIEAAGHQISIQCGSVQGTISAKLNNECGKSFELTSLITPESLSLEAYLSNQEIVCVVKGTNGNLEIYSSSGQLTGKYSLPGGITRIPVGTYDAGIYSLIINSCGSQMIKKIIINH